LELYRISGAITSVFTSCAVDRGLVTTIRSNQILCN